MGHVSLTSTLRYAHLSATALRRAANETHAARSIGCALAARGDSRPSPGAPKPMYFQAGGSAGTRTLDLRVKSPSHCHVGAGASEARSLTAADPVAVLHAVARGDAETARTMGHALALQVVGSEAVRLAFDVLRGGEFVDARIVELCEVVLGAEGGAAVKRGAA